MDSDETHAFRTSEGFGLGRDLPANDLDALHDFFMSREGQRALVERGDLHAIDPTLPGPKGEPSSAALVTMGQPWDRALVEFGLTQGSELKRQFSEAFAR